MATGYSTAVATDADVKKYRPTILHELPTGWTDLSIPRAEAFKRVKRDLLASWPAYRNKVEYLARIVDSTQLLEAEIYATLAHWARARKISEQDHFSQMERTFEKMYSSFWQSAMIQWDHTISVTETSTTADPYTRSGRIVRV